MNKKLYKSRSNVKIDGVAAGIAEFLGLDPTLVRIAWLFFAFTQIGWMLYIACMIIMPRRPAGEVVVEDYKDYRAFDGNSNKNNTEN